MLSDLQLSDLFFNHTHENLLEARVNGWSEDWALRRDAEQFAFDYPQLGKDGEWYYREYLKRR